MSAIDLAIVGAGPAGLAAAATAAELGLSVTVFDENTAPGGQIYRGIEAVAGPRARDLALLFAKHGEWPADVEWVVR